MLFHNRKTFFIILTLIVLIVLFFSNPQSVSEQFVGINHADTAWMIVASALVLLMTPGLAFFYGGMVSKKNVISTMLQSFIALGVISLVWVLFGFSLAFGDSINGWGIIGNPLQFAFLNNLDSNNSNIPYLLFALFQLKFAIITPAIITGSFAERIRFRSYLLFMILFCIFIYTPLAHMTWATEGLFANLGDLIGGSYKGLHVLDFAGGTVVHMSAGLAALAGALYLGKRKKQKTEPANIPYIILGTGLLWFGWFGFNAGSALAANYDAVIAFANTNIASASSMITWVLFDRFLNKKISAVGACLGAIVGLVAITPAAGFVTINHSIVIGFITALVCNLSMISIKKSKKIDDTLDVFASHGIGGICGMLLTAVFAKEVGLVYGQLNTFILHVGATIIVILFTFFGSLIIYKLVDFILPIRVREDQEDRGLDLSQHGEEII
ncbi:MAG: ammonium transporter [Flavobacteriales bacterium]